MKLKYYTTRNTNLSSSSIYYPQQNQPKAKKFWTERQDDYLRKLVEKYGSKNWKIIAQHIPGRNGHQCRLRWINQLNPTIRREEWEHEEDMLLYLAYRVYGKHWSKIAKCFKGRTNCNLKDRWHFHTRRKHCYYDQIYKELREKVEQSEEGRGKDSNIIDVLIFQAYKKLWNFKESIQIQGEKSNYQRQINKKSASQLETEQKIKSQIQVKKEDNSFEQKYEIYPKNEEVKNIIIPQTNPKSVKLGKIGSQMSLFQGSREKVVSDIYLLEPYQKYQVNNLSEVSLSFNCLEQLQRLGNKQLDNILDEKI